MFKENHTTCKNCSCSWSNFKNLTDEQLDLINTNRFPANFKSGEIIFKQGSPTSNAVFLSSGIAKIYMEGYDGKNIILAIVKPGSLIAGPGTYVDNRHHYSLAALTETSACFIDMRILKELVHENSMFAEGYLKDLSQKSLGTFHKLVSFSQKKMHGRLAEGLIHLADDIFNSDKYNCHMTRQELGEFTGMTKESVVRLLKEFHDEEIIHLNDHTIEIINKPKLEKIMISG
ncbi:MAG: Crp/Fnr family transcriptional regulator [Salinivirgaceae bacterium]|jgi:CRP-like cAMP-binding protein|nr:Crp/Fnr family transcriptional regulator [Salinivirgaceae bacterium]